MNSHKVGLALGFLMSIWHLLWAVLVASGLAQPFLDFVLSIHSLNNPYVVQPFDLGKSVGLIIFTFVVGYVVGVVFVKIWKSIHRGE